MFEIAITNMYLTLELLQTLYVNDYHWIQRVHMYILYAYVCHTLKRSQRDPRLGSEHLVNFSVWCILLVFIEV